MRRTAGCPLRWYRALFLHGLYQCRWQRDQGGVGWIQINSEEKRNLWIPGGFAQLQASGNFWESLQVATHQLVKHELFHWLSSIWWIMKQWESIAALSLPKLRSESPDGYRSTSELCNKSRKVSCKRHTLNSWFRILVWFPGFMRYMRSHSHPFLWLKRTWKPASLLSNCYFGD